MSTSAKQNEANVIQNFSNAFRDAYLSRYTNGMVSSSYVGSHLGKQDVELADYLAAVNSRFALIEFKAFEKNLSTEIKRKPLRRKLSALYQERDDLLDMGKTIHFIGWGEKQEIFIEGEQFPCSPIYCESLRFERYPFFLCKLANPDFSDKHSRRQAGDAFINDFFDSKQVGGDSVRFKRYVAELFELAGKDSEGELKTMQGNVFAYITIVGTSEPQFITVPFTGINQLYALTIGNRFERERQKSRDNDEPEFSR